MNAGTPILLRVALRREGRIAPWWILLIAGGALVMIGYINRNMGTAELKLTYTTMINHNAFFRALGGGTVEPDLPMLAAWRSGGFLYLASGLAAATTVIRNTRAAEDSGQAELLRSGPIGRFAILTAALLVSDGVALLAGTATTLVLVARGMPAIGSLAYGAAIAAAGLVFGALGAVAAQLAQTAHTARAIALSALGLAYGLRYAGDATGRLWLKYVSPIGWSHLVDPYRADRWWALTLSLAAAVALAALAYRLAGRRDLGAGLVPESRGPARAPALRGPISLSWRLHRGSLARWAVGMTIFAAGAGAASTLANQLANAPSPAITRLLDAFGASSTSVLRAAPTPIVLIFGYVVALYPVLMVQHMRRAETAGTAELLQGTPMTRLRWAAGHLAVTAAGTAGLLTVSGFVFGAIFAAVVGEPRTELPDIAGESLAAVPAALLVGAICACAYGLAPRSCVPIGWITWIAVVVLGRIVGPLYGLWHGTVFEPFHYIPDIASGAAWRPLPLLVPLACTALLVTAGLIGLSRRDFG
ncbi:ABC transporter permease [Nocardia arthritidis]|uniref:Polyketide antibiotic transporter n=1 Tax=Nocardia arthritidis TaxID=228602 RepID=A0A6G9YLQ5_9NOCA|nr:polyketide antibiotic transporter [Nocardia arthritidis]QIS14138.1 polyketide antibiotic transporter [Nocardia arthritidis]